MREESINMQIARRIFGMEVVLHDEECGPEWVIGHSGDRPIFMPLNQFDTSIYEAFAALDCFQHNTGMYRFELKCDSRHSWKAYIRDTETKKILGEGWAETAPLAICVALLNAVMAMEENP